MQLASPIFLVALFPWVALLLWLLLGKRRRVNVSFLELWKGPVTGPTARRRIGMPPLALVAVLAALLLMILAAARPGIHRTASTTDVPVVIIVDRGITMSMGNPPRFAAILDEIRPLIREQFAKAAIKVVFVPGDEGASAEPTAIQTPLMLKVAVVEQMQAFPASPLIVLSDQDPKIEDKRVVRIAPSGAIRNISIAHIAARISPAAQVQVRIRNNSPWSNGTIVVTCDGQETARQNIDLPASGQTRDYFLPIAAGARVVRVDIDPLDDFRADNVAFLVRRGSWPILEARTPVFAELQRLIQNYSTLRPPGEDAKTVGLVTPQEARGGAEIILAAPGPASSGKATLVDHPITHSLEKVDWESLARDGITEPVGDGWKSLVRIGDRSAIAIRQMPSRQVWMGISTQKLASTPEFVILWSNIFDWVGEGGQEFVAQTTGQLESEWKAIEPLPPGFKPGWWPGIYRRSDGALLAVNAPDVPMPQMAPTSDWRSQLAKIAADFRSATATRWLTIPLLIAALALMVLAAATWRGGFKKNIPQRTTAYARSTSGAIDAT